MWPSIIAVLGTLAGAVVAGALQQRGARADRIEARTESRRRDQLQAVTELAAAIADHRRAMWTREDLRLSGADTETYAAARAASHATRSAITAPQVRLAVLAPELTEVATAAARASYALRSAADQQALEAARTAAVAAADLLVTKAGQALAA
ncbi:protein kilB [Kitasatospora sp. NPDC058478]|uniref:protein kilB n=1 Tax=unclassified Kitasatospora TaxID=2633591 RepID=UPI003661260C